LKLAGNVAHQKALLAGLLTFKEEADALISIDADLQVPQFRYIPIRLMEL